MWKREDGFMASQISVLRIASSRWCSLCFGDRNRSTALLSVICRVLSTTRQLIVIQYSANKSRMSTKIFLCFGSDLFSPIKSISPSGHSAHYASYADTNITLPQNTVKFCSELPRARFQWKRGVRRQLATSARAEEALWSAKHVSEMAHPANFRRHLTVSS